MGEKGNPEFFEFGEIPGERGPELLDRSVDPEREVTPESGSSTAAESSSAAGVQRNSSASNLG